MNKMRKSKGDWSWLRDEVNITRLADLLGVKRQLIDNWIRGRNDPDFLSTLKLARLVGSIEELERRAKVKLDPNLHSSIELFHLLITQNDRNYTYMISMAEHLKRISRFQELHAQAYAALKNVAGEDPFFTAHLWFDIGYAQLMLGYPLEAVNSVRKARKLLPTKDLSVLLADTHWLAGECLRVVGKLSEAYPHLEEARKIYKRLDAKPSFFEAGPVWLEWDLGRYFAAYGRYDTALQHFEQMDKMAKNVLLTEAEVIGAWSRGDIAEMKSEFNQAIASYLYAKELARLINDSFWEAATLWRIAEVYRKLGQFETAITTAEVSRGRFEKIGNARMVAKSECVLAACYLQTRILDKAHDLYSRSIDVFTDGEDFPMEQSIYLGLGLVELVAESQKPTPDYRKPLQAFLGIDAKRSEIHDPYLLVYHDLACAEVLRLAGYPERALTRLDSVIKTSIKYGFQLEKAHALLGTAATKILRSEADRESCNEALKIYQKLGSLWGQIQAAITRVFIEQDRGQGNLLSLQEATLLASKNSLLVESQIIKSYLSKGSLHGERHVLVFIQAV
jgi:tetratricopeptide (TPR) repeat protein